MSVFTMCPDFAAQIASHNRHFRFLSSPWRDYTRTKYRAVFVHSRAGITVTLAPLAPWLREDPSEPRWTVWNHDPANPEQPASWPDTRTGETPWDLWDTIQSMITDTPCTGSAPTPYTHTADTLSPETPPVTANTDTPTYRIAVLQDGETWECVENMTFYVLTHEQFSALENGADIRDIDPTPYKQIAQSPVEAMV